METFLFASTDVGLEPERITYEFSIITMQHIFKNIFATITTDFCWGSSCAFVFI